MLAVEAAPLGAFLPWQPLTEVALPAIASGASAIVTAEVTSRRPAPLGSFANLPPRRLLTALLTPDEEPANRPASPATGVLSLLFGGRRRADLPADLFDLLGRGNPHWAGNLNVFVGGKPVERHRARALRIYPGRANLAFFLLGSGPDAYSLRIEGDGAQWTTLLDATDCASPCDREHAGRLGESQWIETTGTHFILLAMCPPPDWRQGGVEVHVRQRSTDETAVVEFTFDAAAAGPGCYAV